MSKTPTPRKGSASAAKPPRKAACAPAPVAYCGPTIPGKAVQASPVLKALVVPLDQLPEVRRQLQARAGRYYTLCCKAQEIR